MVKKRNILTETKKNAVNPKGLKVSGDTKTAETTENASEKKPRTSNPAGKSRKTQSIEEKRKKDRDYQQKKYDEGKQEATEQTERESKELLLAVEIFACMPFDFAAKRDPRWIISTQEREAFTRATKALIDKYASFVMGYSAEASFALILLTILAPRLFVNAEEEKQVDGDSREASNGKDFSS